MVIKLITHYEANKTTLRKNQNHRQINYDLSHATINCISQHNLYSIPYIIQYELLPLIRYVFGILYTTLYTLVQSMLQKVNERNLFVFLGKNMYEK